MHASGKEEWVEDGPEAIAAAETVAWLMGRQIPDFPEDLADQFSGKKAGPSLVERARRIVEAVGRTSELAELWNEDAEGGRNKEWYAELDALLARLNPATDYVPPTLPDPGGVDISKGDAPEWLTHCPLCNSYVEGTAVLISSLSTRGLSGVI